MHQHVFSQISAAEAPISTENLWNQEKSLQCILDLGIKVLNLSITMTCLNSLSLLLLFQVVMFFYEDFVATQSDDSGHGWVLYCN